MSFWNRLKALFSTPATPHSSSADAAPGVSIEDFERVKAQVGQVTTLRANYKVKGGIRTKEIEYVDVLRANRFQNFSNRLIDRGRLEGWITLTDDSITIRGRPPIKYHIQRDPGRYCCHCSLQGRTSKELQAHVAQAHPGVASPDPENPSGYEVSHSYHCVLAT